jgi:uncharacterized protein (DUF4415 family)
MKPAKAVRKGRKTRAQKPKKTISLQAVAEEPKRRHVLSREVGLLYKPIKRPVTLRLDADVLAWFMKGGRGYQTRINRALRKLMEDETKEHKKASGG